MKTTQGGLVVAIVVLAALPSLAFAHQPRLVESHQTIVTNPEVSKAYYGTLAGVPDVYLIHADTPFDLYVNILVPDIAGQKKDVSAAILNNGVELAKLDGTHFEWKQFFEPFGHDTYWMGPEYKARAEAGDYVISVSSVHNDSKYSLAIGETEAFDLKEGLNALALIPGLKKNFFDESPANFILSPFGFGEILILYVVAFVFGFIYRLVMKKVARNSVRGLHHNIGWTDRLVRLVIGLALVLFAITTSWNPIIIFFSGFALFEAIFSWCGFYAALGKNTCGVE